MIKAFLVRLFPLALICFANVLLWFLLRREFDLGSERGQVYEYFVMYVFYFTLFVAFFCVAASLAERGVGDGGASKAVYFVLNIPPASFSLIVGLLSLGVAFNGVFSAIIPALLYFVALILIARPGLVVNKFSGLR